MNILTQDEIDALMTDDGPDYVVDYESLAKRLLGCMYYGIRIEPYAGHRYIIVDLNADNLPYSMRQKFDADSEDYVYQEKFYGSVVSALNLIDTWLIEANLMNTFEAYEAYIMTNINENGDIDESKVFSLEATV